MTSEEAQFAARADRLAGPRGVVGFMPAAARESALRGAAAVSPQNRYVLPQFSEKTPYGMKTQDPYTKLFEDRIIFMGVQVDDTSADDIMAQLLVLESQDPSRDVMMYINSPGGSMTAMTAIYDTMQYIKPDVATVGLGMCASMGQFLLSSGTKGKRFLTSHARVLMHQPSGGIGGTTTDVRINAELIMDMKKTMSELTAEQTGHTLEEIYRDNEYDHWFTAQEALDYGFVDKLVTTPDTIGNNQQGE